MTTAIEIPRPRATAETYSTRADEFHAALADPTNFDQVFGYSYDPAVGEYSGSIHDRLRAEREQAEREFLETINRGRATNTFGAEAYRYGTALNVARRYYDQESHGHDAPTLERLAHEVAWKSVNAYRETRSVDSVTPEQIAAGVFIAPRVERVAPQIGHELLKATPALEAVAVPAQVAEATPALALAPVTQETLAPAAATPDRWLDRRVQAAKALTSRAWHRLISL